MLLYLLVGRLFVVHEFSITFGDDVIVCVDVVASPVIHSTNSHGDARD